LHPTTSQADLHLTTSYAYDLIYDYSPRKMFTKFIPVAVLISAPLLSNATPWHGFGGAVTVTATVIVCPTASSASASISPSAVPTNNVGGGAAGIPADVKDFVNGLGQLGPLLTTVTNLVSNLLNTVTSGSITGQTSQPQTQVDNFVTQLGTVTNQLGNLNSELNNIANRAASATSGNHTNQLGNPNSKLNNVANRAASATTGDQISSLGQGILCQLTDLINQINSLISAIQNSNANTNLNGLQTTLQNLFNQLSTLYPGLSTQCGSSAQSQALTLAWQTFQRLLNTCILSLN